MRSKFKTFEVVVGFILVVVVVSVAAVFLSNHFLANNSADTPTPTVSCPKHLKAHSVVIDNNKANPQQTIGKLCDTLTITNMDNVLRLIAFGTHEHHAPYDGITEEILDKGQSLTVVLNQAGTYNFHDHIHDWIKGSFIVNQ